ncbi:MAG: MerC domain-containing protein [Planctomycetota bacterium]
MSKSSLPPVLASGSLEPNAMDSAALAVGTSASGLRDWIGIVASVACAIHCAAMPFVIASLPALGLSFLADEAFHKWMALVCFVIAIAAFVPGFRAHRRWFPMAIAGAGLVLITGAAFGLAGDCCATCADVSPDNAASLVGSEGGACTDACCEHCAGDLQASELADVGDVDSAGSRSEVAGSAAVAESNPSVSAASPPIFAWITPLAGWITPLGGLMLVSAHLLNRSYGCRCNCCEIDSSEG